VSIQLDLQKGKLKLDRHLIILLNKLKDISFIDNI